MTGRARRLLLLIGTLLVPPVLLAGLSCGVYQYIKLDMPAPLPEDARVALMAPLRAAIDGADHVAAGFAAPAIAVPEHPALGRRLPGNGPVIVTLWVEGKRAVRVEGHGPNVALGVHDAAQALAADPELAALTPEQRRGGRLQVDVIAARGPYITSIGVLRAFGLVAGLDGVGVHVADRDVVLGADELVEQHLLSAKAPVPGMEFRIGLDFSRAQALLAVRARLAPGVFGTSPRSYFRFRAESFVEPPALAGATPSGPPLPLVRGLPPAPAVSRASLLEAAAAGGRYLVAHLADNGRYVYEVDLSTGKASDPSDPRAAYSLPRHAGTTYYLAELYAETRDPDLIPALRRAIDHMVTLIARGGCAGKTADGRPFTCVVDQGQGRTNMGSTALAVVALAEYRLATGDSTYDELQRALTEWILDLQKPNGRFVHLYDVVQRKKDLQTELLYFDGEATLALVRSYKVFGDERYTVAAGRALDAIIAWYRSTFSTRFFFGEEHWTCISAEAAWPELKKDSYREFCSDYAAFLRTQQFAEGETRGQEDLAGAYSVTPFFVPHNTPVGSRSEAMISAYLLTLYHGKPDDRIRQQVLKAMGYLLRQQVRAAGAYFSPAADIDGAIPSSAVDKTVRIDYVQHACSAMLRARELLAPE